jgi:hypothetical protein
MGLPLEGNMYLIFINNFLSIVGFVLLLFLIIIFLMHILYQILGN